MSGAKRALDVICSGLGLVVLALPFLIAALIIKSSDRGPVFFRQERVGIGGRLFRMWKFRSMVVNADKIGTPLTVGADPRITPIGRLLRKSKMDELPQLVNVFVGEMSLVGPRPEVRKYVDLYTPEQARVLELMPGITDPASIKYRDESEILARCSDPERTYIDVIMPEKIRLNLEYAAHATTLTDVMTILRTLGSIVRRH